MVSPAARGRPDGVEVNLDAIPAGDVKVDKEKGRWLILWGLFIAFGLTLVGAFVGALWDAGKDWSNVKDLLDLLLPAETALLGVAVAFYMT